MNKFYKIDVEERNAVKFKANADLIVEREGVEGYAMMWLNLTNNQKANKKDILKIYNDYDNGVYVICDAEEENVKAVEDYLQRLGLVIEYKNEILVVQPEEIFNENDNYMDIELIDW